MNRLRVAFLVDEERGILRRRADAFIKRLGGVFSCELIVKERYKGDSASRTVRLTLDLLRKKPAPDFLYVVDVGLSSVVVLSALRLIRKTKIVLDTGDLYAELHHESGKVGPLGVMLRRVVEMLSLTQASAIIVRGRLHQAYLQRKGFCNVCWIPDGLEAPSQRPCFSSDAKKRLGVEGRFTIGVMGSAIWNEKYRFCYGWELIELVHLLRDLPVCGIFIGDGDGLSHLKERAKELSVTNRIVFTGRVPYESLPDYLLAMDVCVTTQSNDWIGRVRTTAKLPEYMAYCRYILATDVGEATFSLPPQMRVPYRGKKDESHPARLAERIRALIKNPDTLEDGKALRLIALERFDFDVLAKRVERVLLQTEGRA